VASRTETELEKQMAKRTVEIFTAGCGLCSDTLARVR
jgi:hypothetical protein